MTAHPPLIDGLGTPERRWQAWPGLAALPAVDAGTVLPPGRRVVVVAPHPDDEVLAFGGLLATTRPQRLVLVAASDGTASSPGSTRWSPEELARSRPRETEEALRRLGVDAEVVRLGLPDGEVAGDDVARALSGLVGADDVVLTTWRQDGHPDHEAVGRAAAEVAQAAGAVLVEAPVWAWHWAEPDDVRVPWSRAVRVPLTAEVLDRKRHAVAAFRSQVEPDDALELGAVLPGPVLDRLLRPFEVLLR